MTTADAAWAEIQAFVREVRTPNPCPSQHRHLARL
jgi:hypothetical protein